jgi:plastocyanin
MNKIIVMFVAAIFLTTGCVTQPPKIAPEQPTIKLETPTTQPSAVQPAKPTNETIVISNFNFSPLNLNIAVGSTVTWVNKDMTSHIVKSDFFESPLLQKDESFSYTFKAPLEVPYYCSIHHSMKGTISVK